ncbi:hypothetical protein ACVWU4_000930 [Campylobacter coli]
MNKYDFFKLAFNRQLFKDINWLYTYFGILANNQIQNNDYIKIVDNKVIGIIEDTEYELDITTKDLVNPIYNMVDIIKLDNEYDISNLKDKNITTTLGRLLVNKILLNIPFGDKIEYINKEFSIGDIEGELAKKIATDVISVDEYLKFNKSSLFLQNLSRIVTVSSTPKIMTPPPGIKEFKIKCKKEMEEKYGSTWTTNQTYINEYKDKLKAYDVEYLKDDPGFGKIIAKKMIDNSRGKLYRTFGDVAGLDKKEGKVILVDNALNEGYPKDKVLFSKVIEESVAGSYGRGKETQQGGAAAKDILRATSNVIIEHEDCKSTLGKKIVVTKTNYKSLANRYIIENNKSRLFSDSDKYIDKEVIIRSPMYCKNKGYSICKTCAGTLLGMSPNVSIAVLEVSGKLLTISLKGMHDTNTENYTYDVRDWLK